MRLADFARSLEALEDVSGSVKVYHTPGGLFDKAAAEEIAGILERRRRSTNKG